MGLAAGCCCGLLNGFLIAGLNLSSVIVTLITQKLFQGISYLLSKGMTYSDFPSQSKHFGIKKGFNNSTGAHHHDPQYSFPGGNVLLYDTWKKYSFHGI